MYILGRWLAWAVGGRRDGSCGVGSAGKHTELEGLAFLEDLDCYERLQAGSCGSSGSYLSASLARIHDLVVDRRLWIAGRALHGGLEICVSVKQQEQCWRAARGRACSRRRSRVVLGGTIGSWQGVGVFSGSSSGRSPKLLAPDYSADYSARREEAWVPTAQKQRRRPAAASVHWRTASVRDEGPGQLGWSTRQAHLAAASWWCGGAEPMGGLVPGQGLERYAADKSMRRPRPGDHGRCQE